MANKNKKNEEVPAQEEHVIEAAETAVDTIDGKQGVTEETKDEAKENLETPEVDKACDVISDEMPEDDKVLNDEPDSEKVKDETSAEETFETHDDALVQQAETLTEDKVPAEESIPVDEAPNEEMFETALDVACNESPNEENSNDEEAAACDAEKKSDDDAKAQQEKVDAYARMFGYGYTGQNY